MYIQNTGNYQIRHVTFYIATRKENFHLQNETLTAHAL